MNITIASPTREARIIAARAVRAALQRLGAKVLDEIPEEASMETEAKQSLDLELGAGIPLLKDVEVLIQVAL